MASRDHFASSSIPNNTAVSRSAPASLCFARHAKRKRSPSPESEVYKVEETRPSKQPKKSSTILALSEHNLRRFNAEQMEHASSASSLKRTSSRNTKTTDVSQTTRTTGVSVGSASYRYRHLADAQVFLHVDPPDHVTASIKAVVEAEINEDDQIKLKDIASRFHVDTMKAVRASIGEDDFLETLTDAFKALHKVHLCHRAKSDWREELKPKSRRRQFDLDFLAEPNLKTNGQPSEPDEAMPPSSKRQQQSADQTFISPSPTTGAIDSAPSKEPRESGTMPPPPAPFLLSKEGYPSMIKTPRPDLTIGILNSTLISRLSTDVLSGVAAEQLLIDLQDNLMSREPDRPPEPVLISVPAPRASDIAFPFLVIEGKAYSTGK